jgi:hypothetical protein
MPKSLLDNIVITEGLLQCIVIQLYEARRLTTYLYNIQFNSFSNVPLSLTAFLQVVVRKLCMHFLHTSFVLCTPPK